MIGATQGRIGRRTARIAFLRKTGPVGKNPKSRPRGRKSNSRPLENKSQHTAVNSIGDCRNFSIIRHGAIASEKVSTLLELALKLRRSINIAPNHPDSAGSPIEAFYIQKTMLRRSAEANLGAISVNITPRRQNISIGLLEIRGVHGIAYNFLYKGCNADRANML